MKPAEQKYAMERIAGLAKEKLTAIRKSLTVVKAKKLTYGQALRLIKSGKIKLDYPKSKELHRYDEFSDVFDLKGHHDYHGSGGYDEALYSKKAAPVRKEVQRIKDQIMLGDATEALKLIEKFSAM